MNSLDFFSFLYIFVSPSINFIELIFIFKCPSNSYEKNESTKNIFYEDLQNEFLVQSKTETDCQVVRVKHE